MSTTGSQTSGVPQSVSQQRAASQPSQDDGAATQPHSQGQPSQMLGGTLGGTQASQEYELLAHIDDVKPITNILRTISFVEVCVSSEKKTSASCCCRCLNASLPLL